MATNSHSDVQTRFLAFYLDFWPTTLTYYPSPIRLGHGWPPCQKSRSNGSAVRVHMLTNKHMDGCYQIHWGSTINHPGAWMPFSGRGTFLMPLLGGKKIHGGSRGEKKKSLSPTPSRSLKVDPASKYHLRQSLLIKKCPESNLHSQSIPHHLGDTWCALLLFLSQSWKFAQFLAF